MTPMANQGCSQAVADGETIASAIMAACSERRMVRLVYLMLLLPLARLPQEIRLPSYQMVSLVEMPSRKMKWKVGPRLVAQPS